MDGCIIVALVIITVLIALKTPRWICYIALLGVIIALVAWGVFIDANGPDDAGSGRDEAVEIAAMELLRGNNPWNQFSILDSPITTGHSSILFVAPCVFVSGKIGMLAFFMWCVFITILVFADIRMRNNTFFTILLLLIFPWFGFLHTMHWGLDELYYAAILLPFVWLALNRRQFLWTGVLCGFMTLSRLTYIHAIVGLGLWWLLKEHRSWQNVFRIAIGFLAFSMSVLGLFWIVGGDDFLANNFWKTAQMVSRSSINDGNNAVTLAFGYVFRLLPQNVVLSSVLVTFIVALAALSMRRLKHPFYHIALASLLAHTIAFSPSILMFDYQLIFLIPALYAFCFSPCMSEEI